MEWRKKKKLIHGSTVDLQRKPWDQTAHVHYATKDLPPKLKNIRKIVEYGKATPVLLLVIPSIHRLREVNSWNKILHSSTENRILTVHSGIVSSTGLQAFLSSALDLSPTNPLLGESPPPPIPIASGKTSFLSLSFPSTTSSSPCSSMGCEQNRSLSEWAPTEPFPFFSMQGTASTRNCRSSEPRRRPRVSSIRRVFFWGRPMWTSGLVLGLCVGLGPTPHCVANSLNFCKVAILKVQISSLSLSSEGLCYR